jgi:hypothetical protein
VEPMGFEPTNLTVTPDDSIGFGSPDRLKRPILGPVLDRNWTELLRGWKGIIPDLILAPTIPCRSNQHSRRS